MNKKNSVLSDPYDSVPSICLSLSRRHTWLLRCRKGRPSTWYQSQFWSFSWLRQWINRRVRKVNVYFFRRWYVKSNHVRPPAYPGLDFAQPTARPFHYLMLICSLKREAGEKHAQANEWYTHRCETESTKNGSLMTVCFARYRAWKIQAFFSQKTKGELFSATSSVIQWIVFESSEWLKKP